METNKGYSKYACQQLSNQILAPWTLICVVISVQNVRPTMSVSVPVRYIYKPLHDKSESFGTNTSVQFDLNSLNVEDWFYACRFLYMIKMPCLHLLIVWIIIDQERTIPPGIQKNIFSVKISNSHLELFCADLMIARLSIACNESTQSMASLLKQLACLETPRNIAFSTWIQRKRRHKDCSASENSPQIYNCILGNAKNLFQCIVS